MPDRPNLPTLDPVPAARLPTPKARRPPDLPAREPAQRMELPAGWAPAGGVDRLPARDRVEQVGVPGPGRAEALEQASAGERRAQVPAADEDRGAARVPGPAPVREQGGEARGAVLELERAAWGPDPSLAVPGPRLPPFISDPIRWQSAPNHRILLRLMSLS